MFERYTDRARRVLVLAQDQARTLGYPRIGTETILLGLILEEEAVAAKVLASIGVTVDRVRSVLEPPSGVPAPLGQAMSFTPRAKKVLELSLREALQLGCNYIGTEHMLLALVRDVENGGDDHLFGPLGIHHRAVRKAVIAVLAGYEEAKAPETQSELPLDIVAFFRAQAGDYLEAAAHHQKQVDRLQSEIDSVADEQAEMSRKRDLNLMAFSLFEVPFKEAADAVGLGHGHSRATDEEIDGDGKGGIEEYLFRLQERAKQYGHVSVQSAVRYAELRDELKKLL